MSKQTLCKTTLCKGLLQFFSYSKNMANFEGFLWNFQLSKNPEIVRYDIYTYLIRIRNNLVYILQTIVLGPTNDISIIFPQSDYTKKRAMKTNSFILLFCKVILQYSRRPQQTYGGLPCTNRFFAHSLVPGSQTQRGNETTDLSGWSVAKSPVQTCLGLFRLQTIWRVSTF